MKPFLRASKLDQDSYSRVVAAALTKTYEAARLTTEAVELGDLRVAVISDLHRGARDGSDDFQRAEPAYSAALGYYLECGYSLWLLGDVEELWENDIDEVVPTSYLHLLELEKRFARECDGPGLRRFWGNHDLDWSDSAKAEDRLGAFLPGVPIEEALRLEVRDNDESLGAFFLVHGHQGTDASDRFRVISRFFVRRVWRKVQASQGWLSTAPSYDYELRAKHDTAMFRWARSRLASERLLLIAGHTHHPVFPGQPAEVPEPRDPADLELELEKARAANEGPEVLARIRAEYESSAALGRRRRYTPPEVNDPPCYFNGGCCCYPDGDITCLEIDGPSDEIRLVRWPRDGTHREPDLASDSIRDLFRRAVAMQK
jgi:hypothetical protein